MSNKNIKTTRLVNEMSFFIMITRGDVQRVIDAFILEETLYGGYTLSSGSTRSKALMLGMGIIGYWPDKWRKTKIGSPSNITWTLRMKHI